MKQSLNWTVGFSESPDVRPKEMVTASVPGNANIDWMIAHNLPDWKFGVNFEQYRWMEDVWWLYEARLPSITLKPDESLFFLSEGIDYCYRILLDGELLHEHEGMFSHMEIPIPADNHNGGIIQIWITPPPKDHVGKKDSSEEAAQSCKPAVSYGWDWHPRLIPSGLWCDAYLETRQDISVKNIAIDYTVSGDLQSVEVMFTADLSQSLSLEQATVTMTLYDPTGTEIARLNNAEKVILQNPKLWWCNGYGEPNLYSYEVSVYVDDIKADQKVGKIGFRKLELLMNEGVWEDDIGLPCSRNHAPMTLTLNNVPVFAKGSNWVNPEVFTGTITRNTYLPLIKLAKDANFNLLRCWGGAIVNKDSFFELCDEHGIMVWQDFPLACNDYRNSSHYLKILEQEATAIVKRIKHHACLVIWCGGNELFNSWSKMDDQSLALRLLNKICYEHDPYRPFLSTTPIDGVAHGNYLFRYKDGNEVYQAMPSLKFTAYTEFGVPSISNISCLKAVADLSDIFPLKKNDVTIAHHAFSAWGSDDMQWACLDVIEDYFGEADTLEQLIEWSQWLQGEGYKCIYEEARRQKPYCSMALNWCYNEAWPTIANNALINYPAEPKKSYFDVIASCRNSLISAKIPKFSWHGGETLSFELWLLNDGISPVEAGHADLEAELDGTVYNLGSWSYAKTEANTNVKGITVSYVLPKLDSTGFKKLKLIIKAGELSSKYRLLYKAS